MARQTLRAGVFVEAIILWLFSVASSSAAETVIHRHPRATLNLFHSSATAGHVRPRVAPAANPRHRFYLELDGARAQAEEWLHTAGLSLLEQRDSEGRRSYQVTSRAVAESWPALRLHARVGGPQLSAGLSPRREVPAIGFTITGEAYTVEFEGLKDRHFGTALMTHIGWNDAPRRAQYGVALPVAFGGPPSVGLLLQVRINFEP